MPSRDLGRKLRSIMTVLGSIVASSIVRRGVADPGAERDDHAGDPHQAGADSFNISAIRHAGDEFDQGRSNRSSR